MENSNGKTSNKPCTFLENIFQRSLVINQSLLEIAPRTNRLLIKLRGNQPPQPEDIGLTETPDSNFKDSMQFNLAAIENNIVTIMNNLNELEALI